MGKFAHQAALAMAACGGETSKIRKFADLSCRRFRLRRRIARLETFSSLAAAGRDIAEVGKFADLSGRCADSALPLTSVASQNALYGNMVQPADNPAEISAVIERP
jgi:hypothetical protein